MTNKPESTLAYYDDNAPCFIDGTLTADMSEHYAAFLKYVKPGGRILDAGCGSGRDSLYFKNQGYAVEAFDGSKAMVEYATNYVGIPVIHATFSDYRAEASSFDGIWANASLLHLSNAELIPVLEGFYGFLRSGGALYVSFKYGTEAYEKDGRWFYPQTDESLEILLDKVGPWDQKLLYCTGDVRPGREGERWVNGIFKR